MNQLDQSQQINQLLQRHDRLIKDLDRLNERIEQTLATYQKTHDDQG